LAEIVIQNAATGMVREDKSSKLQYLDYLDIPTLERFARHMHKNGEKHGVDNWKKGGYPPRQYLQSLLRHAFDLAKELDGIEPVTDEDHASAIWFNIQGLMYEQDRT
jgi:hypothetical protein